MNLQGCLVRLRQEATVGDADSIVLGEKWIGQYLEAAGPKQRAFEALRDALNSEPEPLRSKGFWVVMIERVNSLIRGLQQDHSKLPDPD
jgi:hypothetical protein